MKLLRFIVSSVVVVALTISVLADTYDISHGPASAGKRKSQLVTTNDVVFIRTPSGAVAVVQFTSFDADTASYRWRYRAANSQSISSGKGQVRESYDRKPNAAGGYDLTPKADRGITVRAGDVRAEWSYASTTNGWLYFHPSRATIQILNSSAFDKDL